jgi:hypothetical protein
MSAKFLKTEQIPLNTVWYSCDGSGHKVKVIYKDTESPPGWVGYTWQEKGAAVNHEKTTFAFQCRYYLPDETMKIWPKLGDKIRYKGTTTTWFKDLIENAENHLKLGEEYTLARVTVNSSWCSVTLEETGDTVYSMSFFEYEEKQTEKELVEQKEEIRKRKNENSSNTDNCSCVPGACGSQDGKQT